MAQAGVFPWSRPMPHTHANVGQGGLIPRSSLEADCACLAERLAAQVIATGGAHKKILFDSEIYDIGGNFRADGANSDFLVPWDGLYGVEGGAVINGVVAGQPVQTAIRLNTAIIETTYAISPNAPGDTGGYLGAEVEAVVGDLIDLAIYHNHGANRNLRVGTGYCWISIHFIGRS